MRITVRAKGIRRAALSMIRGPSYSARVQPAGARDPSGLRKRSICKLHRKHAALKTHARMTGRHKTSHCVQWNNRCYFRSLSSAVIEMR
jgi:hypothetical protein